MRQYSIQFWTILVLSLCVAAYAMAAPRTITGQKVVQELERALMDSSELDGRNTDNQYCHIQALQLQNSFLLSIFFGEDTATVEIFPNDKFLYTSASSLSEKTYTQTFTRDHNKVELIKYNQFDFDLVITEGRERLDCSYRLER